MAQNLKTRVVTTMLVVAGAVGYADAQDNGALSSVGSGLSRRRALRRERTGSLSTLRPNGWAFGFTYVMPISQHFELMESDFAEGSDVTQYRDVVTRRLSILHDTGCEARRPA
jgi:hypothetical protein